MFLKNKHYISTEIQGDNNIVLSIEFYLFVCCYWDIYSRKLSWFSLFLKNP